MGYQIGHWLSIAKGSVLCGAFLVLSLQLTDARAEDHIVKVVSDYQNMRVFFDPVALKIKPGDSVTWVDELSESHNMVTYPDGFPEGAQGFASPILEKAGDRWTHEFPKAGIYEYHCVPHIMMGMRGKIIVGDNAEAVPAHRPLAAEVAEYRNRLLSFFDEDEIKHMPGYVTEKIGKVQAAKAK